MSETEKQLTEENCRLQQELEMMHMAFEAARIQNVEVVAAKDAQIAALKDEIEGGCRILCRDPPIEQELRELKMENARLEELLKMMKAEHQEELRRVEAQCEMRLEEMRRRYQNTSS